MGNMVTVMCPWDQPVTLTQSWCILELYSCCSSSAACRFDVALPEAQRRKLEQDLACKAHSFEAFLVSSANRADARARANSKFDAVRASVGFAGLDTAVRRTLTSWMVKQLQFRIDGARAAGDERETSLWLNALGVLYLNQGMRGDAVRLFEEAVYGCGHSRAVAGA